VTWVVRANDDRALTNLRRVGCDLPCLSVQAVDLEEVDRLLRTEYSGAIDHRPRTQGATRPLAVEPLLQLEVLLAVTLELQHYRLAVGLANLRESLPGNPSHRASIYALQSFAARRSGDLQNALLYGEHAVRLASPENPISRGRACTDLALACLDLEPPDIARASGLLDEARALFEASPGGDQNDKRDSLLASAEHNRGFLCETAGEYEQALKHYRRALTMKRQIGDLPRQISSERDTALMLMLLNRPREAAPHMERFMALASEYSDTYERAYFDLALGRHRLRQGRATDARTPLLRAVEAFTAIGDQASVEKAHRWLNNAGRMVRDPKDGAS